MKIDYTEYSLNQRIAIIAASELVGYKSCFVGIGIPSDGMLGKTRSVEPELNLIYESGAMALYRCLNLIQLVVHQSHMVQI